MPHHQMVDDFDRPDRRWTARERHEVLAAARGRIRQLPTDTNGNLHVSDVLDALDDDPGSG